MLDALSNADALSREEHIVAIRARYLAAREAGCAHYAHSNEPVEVGVHPANSALGAFYVAAHPDIGALLREVDRLQDVIQKVSAALVEAETI